MAAPPPPYAEKDQYPPGQQQPYPPPGQPAQPGYQQQGGYPPAQGQYPPAQGQYRPPQQGGYPLPQQGVHNTATVITTQPAMVAAVPMIFHEFPVSMCCPSCRAQIVTAVHYDVGTFAWVLCLIMFVTGFWICMFIPFCVDSCKDAIHNCPNCSVQLGVYRRM